MIFTIGDDFFCSFVFSFTHSDTQGLVQKLCCWFREPLGHWEWTKVCSGSVACKANALWLYYCSGRWWLFMCCVGVPYLRAMWGHEISQPHCGLIALVDCLTAMLLQGPSVGLSLSSLTQHCVPWADGSEYLTAQSPAAQSQALGVSATLQDIILAKAISIPGLSPLFQPCSFATGMAYWWPPAAVWLLLLFSALISATQYQLLLLGCTTFHNPQPCCRIKSRLNHSPYLWEQCSHSYNFQLSLWLSPNPLLFFVCFPVVSFNAWYLI